MITTRSAECFGINFSSRVKVKNRTGKPILRAWRREEIDPSRTQVSAEVGVSPTGGGLAASGEREMRQRRFSVRDHTLVIFINQQSPIE